MLDKDAPYLVSVSFSHKTQCELASVVSVVRCGGVFWGNDDLALIYESEWKSRRSVVSTFAPGKPQQGLQVLFDRYTHRPAPDLIFSVWLACQAMHL